MLKILFTKNNIFIQNNKVKFKNPNDVYSKYNPYKNMCLALSNNPGVVNNIHQKFLFNKYMVTIFKNI
jgi:hypothetical protein